MNPFDKYEQEIYRRQLQQRMAPSTGQQAPMGGFGIGPQTAAAAPAPTAQPGKKKKNFLVDNISTVTGTAGSIVGGIAGGVGGAGIGAVPGMAIGGAGGSALGELLENVLTGEDLGKNIGKEALMGGIFSAGPLRLGKTALAARGALNAAKGEGVEMGLKKAVSLGSDEAMKMSLRKGAGKFLTNKSKDFATKQFGFTDNFIAKFGSRHKEDPGKTITRLGLGTIDDIEKHIVKNQTAFDDLVRNANPVDKNTLRHKFAKTVDEFVSEAPSDRKNMARQIQDEVDQMIDGIPGDKIPATTINQIRKQYDNLVNYAMKNPSSSVPYKTDVNGELAKGLREALQEASGSDQLKKTGAELSKLYSLQAEALARAPQVASRASSPLGLRNILGAGIGGSIGLGAGGPVGGLVGAGVVAAANSAPARRMYTQGAVRAGSALTDMGADVAVKNLTTRGILKDQAIRGGLRGLMGAGGVGGDPTQPTGLEDAILGGSNASAMGGQFPGGVAMDSGREDIYGPEIYPNETPWLPNGTSGALDPNTRQPMGGGTDALGLGGMAPQASPYSKEALIYDMNRDPANASKYIAYYQQLDEIFGTEAADPMAEMSQSSRNAMASSDNALNTVSQLEDIFTSAGGAGGRLGGRLKNVAGKAGLDEEAQVYNSMANASVTQIAKALAGSGAGTVSDMDAKVIINALPRFDDTPAEARAKFNALKERLAIARQNTMLYGGGTEEQTTQPQYGGLY